MGLQRRTTFLIQLLMLISPFWSLLAHDGPGEVNRAIAAAELAMKAGKLVEARIELQKALSQEPRNAKASLELGLLFGQEGNLSAAERAFRIVVGETPSWPEAHYNLGLILIANATGKRDWPTAVVEFREAVRLRPDFAEARQWLGTGLSEIGDQEGAIRELRAALAANGASPEIHLHLGNALEATQKSSEAEREYRDAVRLRPAYVEAEIALGKLLLETGAHLEATEHFKRASRANPDSVAAQYGLAQSLKKDGEPAAASVALRQVALLSRKMEMEVRSNRLSNEGLDAAHQGDTKGAIKLLREALDLMPSNPLAHYNLGLVLADAGELAPAAEQVIEAISLAPLELRFYVSLGRVWRQSGDSQRARAAFNRALALDPANQGAAGELRNLPEKSTAVVENNFLFGATANTLEAHFAFALLLGSRGDWMGAAGEWLRVLTLQPNNVDARNNLGISYAHIGKDENAELEFRKALEVTSDSPGAHFGLAVLAMQRGKKANAAQELREVLRVQPDYPQARNLLAVALH